MLFQATDTNFETLLAAGQEGTVLLDFYAAWCAPCRALMPTLDAMTDRHAHVLAYAINTDSCPRLVERFQVQALPTVILLHHGEEIRFATEVTADAIEETIRTLT